MERIPRLTDWCFDIAQRSGVHMVALAQSNKAAFGRRDNAGHMSLGLEDVRGAIQTVADFDNVIGLSRDDWNTDEPIDPASMSAVVVKARHGSGGKAPLVFFKSTGRIWAQVEEVRRG